MSLYRFCKSIDGSCKLSDHMVYNFRPVPNTDHEKKWSPIIDQGCRYQTMVSDNRPGVSITDQGCLYQTIVSDNRPGVSIPDQPWSVFGTGLKL
jgi:hypothetical protein